MSGKKVQSKEIRVTDPKTGGQKGTKIERYDLVPPEAMDEVARVYGTGAQKYTFTRAITSQLIVEEAGACTCGIVVVIPLGRTTRSDSAEAVTKRIYANETLNLRNHNGQTLAGGHNETSRGNERVIDSIENALRSVIDTPVESESSVTQDLIALGLRPETWVRVKSAATLLEDGSISITTTLQDFHEVCSVLDVTRLSVSSETAQRIVSGHTSTCPLHQHSVQNNELIVSGERNWEKGYDWGLSLAALERHLSKFKKREQRDELGNHHLAAVVFHCLALMTFEKYGLGTDTRSTLREKK